jgi:hypothetical protein
MAKQNYYMVKLLSIFVKWDFYRTLNIFCKNPDIFLQNNESFDRVKGKLEDEYLYITCENTNSFVNISWMIIIERNKYRITKINNINRS